MNCTKCGKEIPDGENQICSECQKKILEEIANAEKDDAKQKEDEAIKSNFKTSKTKTKSSKPELLFIILAFIIIIFVAGVYVYYNNNTNKAGNTIGNIRNYGYGAVSGNYIYYLAPNEKGDAVGIFRVNKNGEGESEQLYMADELEKTYDIVSINVVGNYVYFIQTGSTDGDDLDNKIYRMRIDGSDIEVINDNEFNDDCYEIYVINGYIYYIDENENIARMNLDGSNKETVYENGTGYLGITDDYIIYNVENKTEEEDEVTDDTTDTITEEDSDDEEKTYTTYIMNIDGSNQRPLISGKRLFSINIEDDYVYYVNDDNNICRTKIDSKTEEIVAEVEAYNLNVNNGYAYYLGYKDAENEDYTVCIYKIDLNAENKTPVSIKEFSSYSTFLDIVDGFALYMDFSEEGYEISMVRLTEPYDEVQLYYIDYNTVSSYDTEETTEEDTSTTDETTTENTSTENVTIENVTADNTTTENVTTNTATDTNSVTNNVTSENTTNTTTTTANTTTENVTVQNTTSTN